MPKIDIAKYTKQNCNWYVKTGYDKAGKSLYGTPTVIKCRYTPKQQLIKDKAGKETMSKGVFLAFEKIGLEDVLEVDGLKNNIMQIEDGIDLDGNFCFRRCYV